MCTLIHIPVTQAEAFGQSMAGARAWNIKRIKWKVEYPEGLWTVKQLFVWMHLQRLYPHLETTSVRGWNFSKHALCTFAKVSAQYTKLTSNCALWSALTVLEQCQWWTMSTACKQINNSVDCMTGAREDVKKWKMELFPVLFFFLATLGRMKPSLLFDY